MRLKHIFRGYSERFQAFRENCFCRKNAYKMSKVSDRFNRLRGKEVSTRCSSFSHGHYAERCVQEVAIGMRVQQGPTEHRLLSCHFLLPLCNTFSRPWSALPVGFSNKINPFMVEIVALWNTSFHETSIPLFNTLRFHYEDRQLTTTQVRF